MHRLDHAAKLLATFNVLELDGRPLGDVDLITRRSVISVAMRAIGVEVSREGFDQIVEMIAAKNDEVLQALMLDRLDDSLDSRVQVRRSYGELLALDTFFLKRCLELRRELGVAVVDQVSRTMFTRLGFLNELSSLLRHPFRIGIPSRLRADDFASLQVHENQHIEVDDTTGRDGPLREEVAGPECLEMSPDEHAPHVA